MAETSPQTAPEPVANGELEASAEAPAPSGDELVEQELLVEDVSIDGMCGVY